MSSIISNNTVRRAVILTSLTLVSLLLWLSASFLYQAFKARLDAQYLSKHLETDAILRKASLALADERVMSYWLTGVDDLFFAGESLIKPSAVTDDSMFDAEQVLQQIINDSKYADQLRFHPEYLTTLLTNLQQQVSEIADKRYALAQDLKYPSSLRNANLQLEILDYYRETIEQLQLIRHGFSYISSDHSRETQNIFAVSDAAWNIGLSSRLLTALFEGYITSGSTAFGDAQSQAESLLDSIEDNLKTIKQVPAYANIDSQLHTLALELTNWYAGNYVVPAHRLANALTNELPSPYSNTDWKKISRDLAERTSSMLQRADELSQLRVTNAKTLANRNLIIDKALVILCFMLMIWAVWVVRRMHHQAMHDELTGLPNRHLFKLRCDELIKSSSAQRPASLLKVDLHRFRAINDRFGQPGGDVLLQEVAKRLSSSAASSTLVSGMGGNEYAVLLENTSRSKAKLIANNIVQDLAADFHLDDQKVQLSTCIGYSCFPTDASTSEELRKAADLALFGAKQSGAGSITGYNASIASAFKERQNMETDLAVALDRGEFELYYQPQFDLLTSTVGGVEALIRWKHPTRGLVSPALFIPVAEDAGLLPSIGQWVIDEAAAQASRWKHIPGLDLRMSVNVSTHQFLRNNVVRNIEEALARESLDPAAFEIEITESVAMTEVDSVIQKLNTLHRLGIRIALDDFGTGYSSLSYLQDLPLDTLKIDRSFIIKIDHGPTTPQPLLESIASMAKLLDLHTVAEGVETDAQLNLVRTLGFDTIQGYYYSKPVNAGQLPDVVNAINATFGKPAAHAA